MEFTQGGQVLRQWDLRGKCDGLTANPATGQVMATLNEDSAPATTGAAAPNPAYPAVYSVSLDPGHRVAYIRALFYDEAGATAASGPHAGTTVKLGLTDPDSSENVPWSAPRFPRDFMLTSQGDKG